MGKKVVLSSVLINNPTYERGLIEKAGLDLVFIPNDDQETFRKEVVDTDAIITADKPITKEIIDSMNNCKVIVRQGIGYDTIDTDRAREKGIAVCNIPDYCIEEVSDFTITLMLNLLRHINTYDKHTRGGEWDIRSIHKISEFPEMRRLSALTLGIFGFGKIARLVAQKARPFGFRIIATDPYIDPKIAEDMGVELVDFDTAIIESDIISINTPLTPETKHQFNIDVFKNMKSTAYIVNTGRGPLVKEDDLYEALKNKLIAGAALDVTETEPLKPDNKLFQLENLIITPHAAFFTSDSMEELRRRACEEVIRVLSGKEPENRVNK
ncbi:C-terminal binding protein [Clostridiisalibacter paucivorans]|uniref:C-terminal binding protein n=1 Tax=Clostridiisalibacter paucivorans TaxID=408753 RepID=UPI00047B21D3|nr:C-terminal binding protein [Clostridiisalibacter paucivorans]